MTFGQFLSILRARWWLVTLIVVVTMGTALAVSLLLPKQYTAIASVVIDVKPDPVTAVMYAGMATPAYMATQVDVIQSDRVAFRVVRDLKLSDSPQIRQQWRDATNGEGSIEQWLSDTFQRAMDVKPSRESNVISISYKAPDPRFAAGLANAFVQAYIETSLELRVDPAKQYSSFFDTRVKEARDALEKAQAKLSAYQKGTGITATDERFDVESARLNELSSQLVALQALSAESGSRQSQARGASSDNMQEVLANPLIAGLKSDLSRTEAKLQEISARYGESHPIVLETKANAQELRNRIAAETRRVTGGVGINNTITRQREADTRAALEEQRTKVLRLKAVRDDGSVLVRDLENAQRQYDAVTARLNQTSLESQTTQSNAFVLTQATPPLEASSPKVVLNTALALVLGLLLAMGTALALEMLDRRVRGVDEVAQVLGLPVLGIMPKPVTKRLFGGRKVPLMETRIMARLPASASKGA